LRLSMDRGVDCAGEQQPERSATDELGSARPHVGLPAGELGNFAS
jgi:hypothetical protein